MKPRIERAVEGEVVVALDQELLVVVQHVQPAFEIAEEHGHRLDALLVGQILEPLFAELVGRNTVPALLLGREVQLFELSVREFEKIAKWV